MGFKRGKEKGDDALKVKETDRDKQRNMAKSIACPGRKTGR